MTLFKRKYHWFRGRIAYSKNGRDIFYVLTSVGCAKKKAIENHRGIKMVVCPRIISDFIKGGNKKLLNNGVFSFEPTAYLGRWETNDTRL